MSTNEKLLTYKGYPLVRSGNVIYFGNSYDSFIIKMIISSTRAAGNVEIADNVEIQLLNTDSPVRPRVVKKSERKGMYAAMDIAFIWLERANAPKKA